MQSIEDFIAEQGITIETREGDLTDTEQRDEWKRSATKWRVTIRRGKGAMHVPFFMGSGHNGVPPTAADVLDTLASDASGIENADGFEDWAMEYGYDTDSIRANRIYRQTVGQTKQLRDLMGDAYNALVWETERQ